MAGLGLFLVGSMRHLPKFKLNLIIVGRQHWLSEGHEPHLNHSSPKLSSIIEFRSDVFCNLWSGLREGILSRHYIIDGVLDVCTLAFELGFPVSAASILVASSLIQARSGATALISVHGRGAPLTSWIT